MRMAGRVQLLGTVAGFLQEAALVVAGKPDAQVFAPRHLSVTNRQTCV